jgi:peptidoglycan/LPS O-acetylase OafA/YrhL
MAAGNDTVARGICGVVGIALLALGVVGLALHGLGGFEDSPEGVTPRTDQFIGGSTLMDFVHIVLGAVGVLAAWKSGARLAGWLGVLAFLGLLAYDVVALIADDPDDPLGTRWPTTVLHGVCLLAAAAIVLLDNRVEEPTPRQVT